MDFQFKLLKKDKSSNARLGKITTPHVSHAGESERAGSRNNIEQYVSSLSQTGTYINKGPWGAASVYALEISDTDRQRWISGL